MARTQEGKEKRRIRDKECKDRKRKENNNNYRIQQLLYQSRARARNKNLEHNLELQDILDIWPVDNKCPVYGFELVWNDFRFRRTSPSIDRIDSTKGYIKDNVQIISFRANELKRDATLEELEILVNYLKEFE